MWNPFKRDVQPESPKKRRKAPKLNTLGRSLFAAADTDRNNSSWSSTPIPIGQVIDQKLLPLVARSREQISNNDYAKGFRREVRKNVLGHKGICLQVRSKNPDGTLNEHANEAVEFSFKRWGKRKTCSIDGRLDWVRLKRVVLNTVVGSGEAFVRIVEGESAGSWGFSLQLIDPLRVPVHMNDRRLSNGNVIRHGIEMTPFGRPVAYYVETKAGVLAQPYRLGGKEFERVPADDMLHIFDQEEPEQFRGIPWTATSLRRLRNLNGLEETVVINARSSSSKTLILQADPDVYEVDDEEEMEEPEIDLEPNEVVTLPPGFTPINYSPDFPNDMAPLSKQMLRGAATGFGTSYNTSANDLEGVNYSSIRQGKLDERDGWKDLQEWFIEAFCSPVYERWLGYSLLARKIHNLRTGKPLAASKMQLLLMVEWQARRWDWVDPLKDEKAATEATANLRKSPGQAIRESGGDPRDVWKAYADDINAMKAAGIPEEKINLFLGLTGSGGNADGDQEKEGA